MDSHVEEIAVDTIGTAVEPVTVEGRSSEIESVETITFDSAIAPVVPQPRRGRPMQKARFAWGLLLSTGGIGLMLIVAVGALHGAGVNGRLSLPVVGLCMIIGLMLLGGGFGVMATASPTFDDDEFDRLMQAGDAGLPDVTPIERSTMDDIHTDLLRDQTGELNARKREETVLKHPVA